MFYTPHACSIGFRDVIAAWLVCLAVAVTGIAGAAVVAAPDDPAAEARALPHAPPATPRAAICAVRNPRVETPRG